MTPESSGPWAAIDRRSFLRTTAGGSIAIAIVSMLPAGCAADYPDADRDGTPLSALTEKEYATARAAAEALLRGVPADTIRVVQSIDRELALVGDPMRSDMKTVLGLIEHMTFLGGHVTGFTRLSPDARVAYLNGWRDSRFSLRRAAFQAIKSFVYFFAYVQDSTRTLTGFPGPWQERVRVAARPVDFGPIA